MIRVRGLIIFIGGMFLVILGIGMWRSPEIDWEGFISAWFFVVDDIIRLTHDPFAILGVVVVIIGLFIAVKGIRRLVLG